MRNIDEDFNGSPPQGNSLKTGRRNMPGGVHRFQPLGEMHRVCQFGGGEALANLLVIIGKFEVVLPTGDYYFG
jgi:hypothetical protein